MKVELPLNDEKVEKLRSGETVLLTGTMYVGRDSAHKKLVGARTSPWS
jgi:fumarate hydratase subunit beta